ncbi:MAG: HAD family hydrolase [Confluentibacter sp.]|nr:HAD family hydrolase [Confluentibacter sp.]
MDFKKVKLVVTDMDGTLLNPNNEVSSRFLNQFTELKKRNIHFVAASGRQYQSIVDKLELIQEDISIIAENGGILKFDNNTDVLLKLSSENIAKAIGALRSIDAVFIVLCGRKSAYIETTNPDFIAKFEKYYSKYTIVEDLTTVTNDDFLKIAVYHFECSEKHILPHITELKTDMQVIVSGQNWLDISHRDANKGYALNILQEKLGITKEETMVFGDYNNDLQMLELADFSYAMANAHAEVKKIARFETKSNADEGVEFVLDQLLNGIAYPY